MIVCYDMKGMWREICEMQRDYRWVPINDGICRYFVSGEFSILISAHVPSHRLKIRTRFTHFRITSIRVRVISLDIFRLHTLYTCRTSPSLEWQLSRDCPKWDHRNGRCRITRIRSRFRQFRGGSWFEARHTKRLIWPRTRKIDLQRIFRKYISIWERAFRDSSSSLWSEDQRFSFPSPFIYIIHSVLFFYVFFDLFSRSDKLV